MTNNLPENSSREQILEIQNCKLATLVSSIVPQNRFWTQKFSDAKIDPAEIQSVDQLAQLPFTTKEELVADQQKHSPYGSNLTSPLTDYFRLHQTSGTTGQPMRWLDTPASWDWFMECWRQIYAIIGLRAEDRLCFPFSFGPFIGFWAAFEGAQRLNHFCIATGGLSSEARLRMILDHNVTVVCCTPTYAQRLAEVAQSLSLDLAASSVRMLIVAGEPGGCIPATRKRIETAWGARVFDHWGMTDIGSLAIESIEDPSSLLVLETECIAEIIDPETEKPVAAGEQGELVLTNLGRTGMPLLRYRTGDLVQAATAANRCGRSLLRLEGGILARCDDMVTIRGNNLFPSSLEAVLREFDEVVEYRATVETQNSMHQIRLEIELTPKLFAEGKLAHDEFLKRCDQTIKNRLNFHAKMGIVPPQTLPRFEMKGKRFIHQAKH